jgi:3-phosphoshikimate 1-carboxyvinyltransferase
MIGKVRRICGSVRLPGDKSIAHRAVMLSGICRGTSRIANFPFSRDSLSTVACLRALGVRIDRHDETGLVVHGRGLRGLQPPRGPLDAGNSGTTMRLLSGLLAGQDFPIILNGDDSLRRRPMRRIIEPLRAMGAEISGAGGDRFAPLRIRGGRLRPIDYTLPVASAQLKSALLLAGLYAPGKTTVRSPAPSRDHTERMLIDRGADLTVSGDLVAIRGGGEMAASDITLPGDLSSAAFFLAAAILVPGSQLTIEGVGVNPTRTGLLDVLADMGVDISISGERSVNNEPVADLMVRFGEIRATEVSGPIVPSLIDELPVLAVLATRAKGTTVVRDATELRIKETDRIAAMAEELGKMGARIEATDDGWIIEGPVRLRGATVESRWDHRIAMALAVAALAAEGETCIQGAESVEVSFPGFWEKMKEVSEA